MFVEIGYKIKKFILSEWYVNMMLFRIVNITEADRVRKDRLRSRSVSSAYLLGEMARVYVSM